MQTELCLCGWCEVPLEEQSTTFCDECGLLLCLECCEESGLCPECNEDFLWDLHRFQESSEEEEVLQEPVPETPPIRVRSPAPCTPPPVSLGDKSVEEESEEEESEEEEQ